MTNEVLKKILISAVQEELRDREFPAATKFVITATSKGVTGKEIEVSPPVKRTRITKQEAQQIKTVKKVVKVNTDVTYVLALLNDLQTATKQLDYKHLTEEAVSAIKTGVEAINKNTTLLIEFKGETNV